MRAAAARPPAARTVRDVMASRVVTVVPEMTARELVDTFLEEHVRGAPVLDRAGKVIGMVSERDVLRHARGDLSRVRVGDIMGPVGETFTPDAELRALARFFAADGVQRVAVVEHGILLGIVTPADVLRGVTA